ncbi:CD59 glycoprotein [Odocoileus virginianus]|uniref:MAC-inhibitory protein n=1 Tax=Odocoileus virginianus TaxID=9874 RepID=A0ABM4IM54_ODOVR
MASKGGYILLGLLFFLAVLCQLGHSLQCYSCVNQVDCTTATNCSHNQDACLYVKAALTSAWERQSTHRHEHEPKAKCTLEKLFNHISHPQTVKWESLSPKVMPLKFYHQCWKFQDCSFESIARILGEKELQYHCCQKNLCNKSDGTSISEKTPLLITLLLVAVCRFYL